MTHLSAILLKSSPPPIDVLVCVCEKKRVKRSVIFSCFLLFCVCLFQNTEYFYFFVCNLVVDAVSDKFERKVCLCVCVCV